MNKDCDYTVAITFRFKDCESKQKFTDWLADKENGLSLTRAWEGCKSVEVYESSEDENTLILWEKWEKKESQESYMKMRTETGAFDTVGDWLVSPPEVLSLKPTTLWFVIVRVSNVDFCIS